MAGRTLCSAAGLLMACQTTAWSATFAVNDLADAIDAAPGNGVCATVHGTCTLRAAIQETNALPGADQVTLAIGVHELTLDGADEDAAATGDLDITDALTIAGINAYLAIIDANGGDRVLDQIGQGLPGKLVLRDLSLTGGDASGDGGGLRFAGVVTAERIIVRNNRAGLNGGGMASGAGRGAAPSMAVNGSIVSLNTAGQDGGGAWIVAAATTSVTQSIVIANSAARSGGGLFVDGLDVPVRVERTTVYGNNGGTGAPSSSSFGGGAFLGGGKVTLDRSWVGHNRLGGWAAPPAGAGGGVNLAGSDAVITNSTVENNLAEIGGGIMHFFNELTMTHATVARNRAVVDGGISYSTEFLTLLFRNNILAENSHGNCIGLFPLTYAAGSGHNLTDDATCEFTAPSDLANVDAKLGVLGDYGGPTQTIPPLAGSPALDGGGNAGILVDQRGVTRPKFAGFDIGAVEKDRRVLRSRSPGSFTPHPHRCDLDRNGRVDFSDLSRLIESFPAFGGRFRGNADRQLKSCVASCTQAGCPPVALIPKPRGRA